MGRGGEPVTKVWMAWMGRGEGPVLWYCDTMVLWYRYPVVRGTVVLCPLPPTFRQHDGVRQPDLHLGP